MLKNIRVLRKSIISVIITLLLLTPAILLAENKYQDQNQSAGQFSLLLNSGLTDCQNATVRYIVWTQESRELSGIEEILPETDLLWHKYLLQDFSGNKAWKYVAELNITEKDEREALERYLSLKNKISNQRTKIYFEERVESAIHSGLYFKNNDIKVREKVQSLNIESFRGYLQELSDDIQIMSKENTPSCQGRTVLAIPVLLEEF